MDAHKPQPDHNPNDDCDHDLLYILILLRRNCFAGDLIGSFDRPHNGIDPGGDSSRQVSGTESGHNVISDDLC